MKLPLIKLLVTICIITIVCFSACKKYPENTLWLKNPKRICPVNGSITSYKVNGIDSLDLLDLYYKVYPVSTGDPYIDNPNKEFKKELFISRTFSRKNGIYSVRTQHVYFSAISVIWDQKKKSVIIYAPNSDTIYYKKNIFIEEQYWEVIYLDKNGKSKIKTTFNNGNTYEITFN